MAVKNEKYWAERFKQLEASQHHSSEKLVDEIQQQMCRAEVEIERKINAWYGRLMANNGVSMAEAKRLLNNKELEEFRWDVKDYIKHGQDNAYTQQWMKELENASARAHISRLEQLKLQVQQEAEKLYGNYLDSVDRHMKSLYEEGFYKTAYEIQKGVGVGWNLTGVDSKQLEKIIRKPWAADRKNFSERIWSSKQQLIDNVHTSLTQMCILGQSPDRAINSLAKAMQTSKNQAGRLIMTEAAFFGSEARKDSFQELGVEQYEIVATLDSITSEICREMDGKVFPMSEYAPGATAPPFHVWCRTTTIPAFGDEFDHIGERAARDADGKTYYVPADMKYQEWKERYVDGVEKAHDKTDGADTRKDKVSEIPLQEKISDEIMDDLPRFDALQTESDLQNFAEQLIDNLGIERTGIDIQVKGLVEKNGACEMDVSQPADLLVKCKYKEYALNSIDERSMEYRVKTAFHESYHLSLNGRKWDALNRKFEVNTHWEVMEETFAESSAHYMIQRYGITKKLAPSYPDMIVRNLPRLKQLDEFSECKTIQDFGKIAFEMRQNGADGVWKQMYNRMRKIKLDNNYYVQYHDYIREHVEDVFAMACENVPGLESYKAGTIEEVYKKINFVENTGMQPDSKSVYYWLMSCAMQLMGVK